jgi:hypothetical protein
MQALLITHLPAVGRDFKDDYTEKKRDVIGQKADGIPP